LDMLRHKKARQENVALFICPYAGVKQKSLFLF
jgi:hypothetical protein